MEITYASWLVYFSCRRAPEILPAVVHRPVYKGIHLQIYTTYKIFSIILQNPVGYSYSNLSQKHLSFCSIFHLARRKNKIHIYFFVLFIKIGLLGNHCMPAIYCCILQQRIAGRQHFPTAPFVRKNNINC